MPKHIAAAAMEGTTKRRWYKTQRDENEGDLNIMGIKKQAGNGQKLLGMEEDCTGIQGPQQIVAL